MAGPTAPHDEQEDPGRQLRVWWGVVRFGLLLLTAVCVMTAYAGGRGGTTEVVACVVGTVAVAVAAAWDAWCRQARNALVGSGRDQRRHLDPLDSYHVVVAFAVFVAIFAGTLPGVGVLNWVLLAVCASAAAFSWASFRRQRLR